MDHWENAVRRASKFTEGIQVQKWSLPHKPVSNEQGLLRCMRLHDHLNAQIQSKSSSMLLWCAQNWSLLQQVSLLLNQTNPALLVMRPHPFCCATISNDWIICCRIYNLVSSHYVLKVSVKQKLHLYFISYCDINSLFNIIWRCNVLNKSYIGL